MPFLLPSSLCFFWLAFVVVTARAQEPVSLFNGTDLEGWEGDPRFWKVEDGAITGQTSAEVSPEANTFLIWKLGEVDDFELTAEYKIESGNSGIQVRSYRLPDRPWGIAGYQADLEAGDRHTGLFYGENDRGILADRGQITSVGEDHKPTVTGKTGDPDALQALIKRGDWNTYRIVARGYTLQNYLNGQLMAQVTDGDLQMRQRAGLLALQIHAGLPMKVQFRNLQLKRLPLADGKKVVFISGTPSHSPGEHEHRAGATLLARSLNESSSGKVLATVYSGGWPQDPTAFSNADAIVMFCDGGAGHMVNPRLADLEAAHQRGIGIGCIHYAVEIPKGPGSDAFLRWIGGYFETDWSVNPQWEADFSTFPNHPVVAGLTPFKTTDEWYYHLRFRENMQGITPLLTALPPTETLNLPDGIRSGNPAVRQAIANREPQHLAWVCENANNSRGFGFTGAHFHKNWRQEPFRRLALNAIAWIAKADLPPEGILSRSPNDEEIEANLDPKSP